MSETITTLHPEGKQGVNISRAKYDAIKDAIVDVLKSEEVVDFRDLITAVEEKLAGSFDGSVVWYVTTVKLDLEARGVIERVPKSSPQQLRLVT